MTGVEVVIPAYNAATCLRQSVPAALEAAHGATVWVVDAGSTDDSGAVARALGARVVRLAARAGPAEARNVGVAHSSAEVILFIDSDCVAQPDLGPRVAEAFEQEPELVSLCGSYDAAPPERNFFSQYMNLRHHFTHQRARREDATFWAGCGAVRRDAFLQAGGFDAERYPVPMIEDIELGVRLAPLGRRRLDPMLQVTHLKRWTLRSAIETDIRMRAIPWARLVARTGSLPNDLNLRLRERHAAALAPLALLCLPLLVWAVVESQLAVAAACTTVLAASWLLNAPLLSFFRRRRGTRMAIQTWLFHQLHLSYSGVIFLVCLVLEKIRPSTERP